MMPSTPWSVLYNKLPPETRARIQARNRVLTELLERYAEERDASPESEPAPDGAGHHRRVRLLTARRKRKRVQCFGHGVLNAGPHYRTAWQDVWLRWKGSDRKVHRSAPCVLSYHEAVFDKLSAEADLTCEADSAERARLEEHLAEHQAAVAQLDAHEYHIENVNGPCPNVKTWAPYIDRAEAERMLAHLMEVRFGVKHPKFVWRRHKGRHGPVIQHSFMPDDNRDAGARPA